MQQRGCVKLIDCTGRELASHPLPKRWITAQAVFQRHAPKTRAVIISRHRRGDILRPTDDNFCPRAQWSRTVIRPTDVIVITQLPGFGGGQQSGTALGLSIGLLALSIALPFALPVIAPAIFAAGSFLTVAASAGIVLGASYAIGKMTKSTSQTETDDRPLFGVTGGGNLPRPGDHIPKPYGQVWNPSDLSQQDWFIYDGEDVVLYKRHTVGLGKQQVNAIRLGGVAVWNSTSGVLPPFNGSPGGDLAGQVGRGYGGGASGSGGGTEVEIINPGAVSTIVPGSVYSSPDVTGIVLPYVIVDIPGVTPWFAVTPPGETTSRIQIDFSAPNAISHNNGPTAAGAKFELSAADVDGNPIGPVTTLHEESGVFYTTRGVRLTRIIDVADGQWLVRAQNIGPKAADISNTIQWDGLRAHYAETIVRPHVTEVAIKIRSGKNLGINNFADVEINSTAILPVWNGSAWVEQPTRKAVYAWLDVFRATYGAEVADAEIDLERVKFYASTLTEFDTFDGLIRGPVSVWEAANTVLGPMRGETTRIAGVWSIERDEADSTRRHHISRRQILEGTTTEEFPIARDDGLADVIVEYNPECDPKRRRDVRVTFGEQSRTPLRVKGFGISSWDYAHHYATYRAAAGFYRRILRKGTIDRRGRTIQRGNTAIIDAWFASDSMRAAGVLAFDTLQMYLDAPVDFSVTPYLVIRDRKGLVWGPVLVTAGANDSIVNLNSADVAAAEAASGVDLEDALLHDNEEMTSVLVGPIEEVQERYIIDRVEPQDEDRITISALFDAPEVWDALGEAPPPEPPIPTQQDMIETASADLIWIKAKCAQKALNLVMEWAVSPLRSATAIIVKVSYNPEDDTAIWEDVSSDLSTNGSYVLRHEEGIDVKVAAWAINRKGLPGQPVYAEFTTFKPEVSGTTATLFVDPAALTAEVRQFYRDVNDRITQLNDLFGDVIGKLDAQRYLDLLKTNQQSVDRDETVSIEVGKAKASLSQHLQLISAVEGSFASYTTRVEARFGEHLAFIQTNETAIATTNETIASLTVTVSATLDAHEIELDGHTVSIAANTASITVNSTAIVTLQGYAAATYSLVVDAGGRIASMQLIAGGGFSAIKFKADAFLFSLSGYTDVGLTIGTVSGSPAIGWGGNILLDGILTARQVGTNLLIADQANIGTAKVKTLHLEGASVTRADGIFVTGPVVGIDSVTWVTAATINLSFTDTVNTSIIPIFFGGIANQHANGGVQTMAFQVLVNGSPIQFSAMSGTPAAGDYRFTLSGATHVVGTGGTVAVTVQLQHLSNSSSFMFSSVLEAAGHGR